LKAVRLGPRFSHKVLQSLPSASAQGSRLDTAARRIPATAHLLHRAAGRPPAESAGVTSCGDRLGLGAVDGEGDRRCPGPGSTVGYVGVPHDVELPIGTLFFGNVGRSKAGCGAQLAPALQRNGHDNYWDKNAVLVLRLDNQIAHMQVF
jgi:hypothetical protein